MQAENLYIFETIQANQFQISHNEPVESKHQQNTRTHHFLNDKEYDDSLTQITEQEAKELAQQIEEKEEIEQAQAQTENQKQDESFEDSLAHDYIKYIRSTERLDELVQQSISAALNDDPSKELITKLLKDKSIPPQKRQKAFRFQAMYLEKEIHPAMQEMNQCYIKEHSLEKRGKQIQQCFLEFAISKKSTPPSNLNQDQKTAEFEGQPVECMKLADQVVFDCFDQIVKPKFHFLNYSIVSIFNGKV